MKIVRSWPSVVPEDRAYVVDTIPRFVMDDYSYRGLGDLNDDVLLVEWDIAFGQDDLELFRELIRPEPERVLVAPYRIYQTTRGKTKFKRPFWVHRRYTSESEASMRQVVETDETCHLWGLGMTYLPREFLRRFLEAWPGHAGDGSMSGWHHRNYEQETRIAWGVRPVHLHYPIERTG